MTEPPEEDPQVTEKLNHLIRQMDSGPLDEADRPSDDLILLYLSGKANPAQREQMIAALNASPIFRAEVGEMVRHFEALQDSGVRTEADAVLPPEPPGVPTNRPETTSVRPRRSDERRNVFGAGKVVLALAAVILLAVIGFNWRSLWPASQTPVAIQPDQSADSVTATVPAVSPQSMQLVIASLDPGLLYSDASRSTGQPDVNESFVSPDSAALASIRAALRFDNETFVYHVKPNVTTFSDSVLLIRVTDKDGAAISEAYIPKPVTGSSELTLWIFGIATGPRYSLYKTRVIGDTVVVPLDNPDVREGALTITFSEGSQYSAAPAIGFTR